MANSGRFTDRSPYITAAGKTSGVHEEESVWKCMQYNPVQDQADALKHDEGVCEEQKDPGQVQPPLDAPHLFTETHDEKENSCEAYWHNVQKRHPEPVSKLAAGMEPDLETSLEGLVNPQKTVNEVLFDSQVGHDHYITSHDDYNPGEQVNRRYSKSFNKDTRYGMGNI